ncbi:tetratricopeptide repeat protein, partial [Candidatus Peregrinibacteria bacterium]|nr:tetratricopeptide repeat protein [Candidatus Peregrinibacteria bacterium]
MSNPEAVAEAKKYVASSYVKYKAGDYKGAIEELDRAIELNPAEAVAYHNRGVAKHKLGDLQGTIADYQKAIELNPANKEKLEPMIKGIRERIAQQQTQVSGSGEGGQERKQTLSQFIPGYVLEVKLGEGGMGAVYKARQLSLNREVAIKILSPKLTKDPKYVARFEREAKIAGTLNHKNITSVLETGVAKGYHYYVMEYVEGISLHKVLAERKALPEQEALAIIEEVSEALEHAEKHKIIHRDIKPDNIMMTKDGHAKLCDLGIAKQMEGELAKTLTVTGETFFTPHYVSPEQLEGGELDIRTDIYSLGVTLYEIVTGRLPFTGETSQEVASKRLTKSPIPPKKLNPKISQNLNNLILRMMARRPEHRYPNPTQLIKSIQHFRKGGHISAPPKPYTKWVALAAVVLIAIIAITIFLSSGGASEKELKLYNDTIANAQKLLDEGKYSDAIKIAKSFPATDEELKVKVKDFVNKIHATARQDADALVAYSNSLFTKCDFDNAVGVFGNAKSLYEATDSNEKITTAITEMNKKVEERKAEAKKFYDWGFVKISNGNSEGALSDFDKAISINPNYAEAHLYRGAVRDRLGDNKGAIEDYDKAIEINPNDANAYFSRGVAKSDLGDYKGQLEDCNKAIELNPNHAMAYHNRGLAKGRSGDYEGAIEDYNKAIELKPNDVDMYLERGKARTKLKKNNEAITDFDKVLELNPNNIDAYLNRAELKAPADAIKDYNEIIRLEPNNIEALYKRADCKAKTNDYKVAMEDLDKVIKMFPMHTGATLLRAEIKFKTDDNKGTIADYDKLVQINPRDFKAYQSRGVAKFYTNDIKGALADFDKAIQLAPDQAGMAYRGRCMAKITLGELKGVEEDFQKAVKIGPSTNMDFQMGSILSDPKKTSDQLELTKISEAKLKGLPEVVIRGYRKQQLGDYLGALNNFNEALELNPDSAFVYACRGNVKIILNVDFSTFTLKNSGDIIKDAEKAIQLNPALADGYIIRGTVNFILRKFKEVVLDFEKAVELEPLYKDSLQSQIDMAKGFTQQEESEPENATGYINRATLKLTKNDIDGAIKDCDKAIELNPELPLAYFTRGTAMAGLDNVKGALEDAEKSISLNPDFGLGYILRGSVEYHLGKNKEALADLEKGLELVPASKAQIQP